MIGGVFFYISIKKYVNREVSHSLKNDMMRMRSIIAQSDTNISKMVFVEDNIKVLPVNNLEYQEKHRIKDTTIIDKRENEEVPARAICFYAKGKSSTYKIIIVKSLLENDDLIEKIVINLLQMLAIFLVAFYFGNRYISKKIWKPFYITLDRIKKFDLMNTESLDLPKSNINEFVELNTELTTMTDRIQKDYRNLKEFTENASHEMQTPLSIIESKLDILIQSDSIAEEHANNVNAIYNSMNRLSRINKSLLLLAKIDNFQYNKTEAVDFKMLVEKQLDFFEDILQAKGLKVSSNLGYDKIIVINFDLADILVSNLLSNAIKHNVSDGTISVMLTNEYFEIKNTGKSLTVNPDELFERFKKDSASDSVGLGLSIVKRICDASNISIIYIYIDGEHRIRLDF